MTVPFTSLSGEPERPIRWWQWRRRAARLRFLELLARTEIRVSLDGQDRLAGNLESAYHTVVAFGSADHARGLVFADLLRINSGCAIHDDDAHEARISIRLPMDVRL